MAKAAQHTARYRQFRAFLRVLREEAGISQRELGRRLGRVHTWVSKSEAGDRRVDLLEFEEWCEALGLNPVSELRRFRRLHRE